ncbi:MAG: hypothetical protein ACLQD8_01145 [Thermoplasmata archaeon]
MPGRAILIAVDGISGSGKSTLVARAAATFGWIALAEAFDRLEPRPRIAVTSAAALARVERLLLEEESRRWRAARELCSGGATVITDTGFLGPLTYSAGLVAVHAAPPSLLRDLVARSRRLAARGAWGMPDLVVYLATGAAVRRRRTASDAVRHPPALVPRHEAIGLLEERFYAELLPRAFPGRVRWIDGDGPVDSLVAALGRTVRGVAPRRTGPRGAGRVLDLVAEFPSHAGAAPSATSGNR